MTTNDSMPTPFVFRDAAAARRLREVLANAGFTPQGVLETLGGDSVSLALGQDLPLLLRRTGGGTPRETLVRLFLIGTAVDADAAAKSRRADGPGRLGRHWG